MKNNFSSSYHETTFYGYESNKMNVIKSNGKLAIILKIKKNIIHTSNINKMMMKKNSIFGFLLMKNNFMLETDNRQLTSFFERIARMEFNFVIPIKLNKIKKDNWREMKKNPKTSFKTIQQQQH